MQGLIFYSGNLIRNEREELRRRIAEAGFMKKAETEAERCVETFDEHRCSLKQGHRGKHRCFDDCSVSWTDAGKARVLSERADADELEAKERLALIKELGFEENNWACAAELRKFKAEKLGKQ